MATKKVSMADVAKKIGVSRATVSYVINNIPNSNISDATRKKVWEAVEELGYRTNAFAKCLRGGKSDVLGFITDNISDMPFIVDIIKGAQDEALANNKLLLVMDVQSDPQTEEKIFSMMDQWQVRGVIYATTLHRSIETGNCFFYNKTILVDCFSTKRDLPSIVPNEIQGGYIATKELIKHGYKKIALINGPASHEASIGRLEGFKMALNESNLTINPQWIKYGDWWQESGYDHALDLLSADNPPEAIFCANDWMAMGAYDAAKKIQFNIPNDVAVIGFDNRQMIANHMHPALTTVALPYYEMGKEAIRMLLLNEEQQEIKNFQKKLDCTLVLRQSI